MWVSLQSFMFQGSSAATARNINYVPRCSDQFVDSDDDSRDDPIIHPEAPPSAPDAFLETNCSTEFAVNPVLESKEDRMASLCAGDEAQELIYSFCSRTSITKVAPTQQELETLPSKLHALIAPLCIPGKVLVCTAVVSALSEQLSSEVVANEWKPPLRALCVLRFFFCEGELERHISEAVLDESWELVEHLTEVVPCREVALQVLQLRKVVAMVSPAEQFIVTDDGQIILLKADDRKDIVVAEDDRDTKPGSSSSSASDAEAREDRAAAARETRPESSILKATSSASSIDIPIAHSHEASANEVPKSICSFRLNDIAAAHPFESAVASVEVVQVTLSCSDTVIDLDAAPRTPVSIGAPACVDTPPRVPEWDDRPVLPCREGEDFDGLEWDGVDFSVDTGELLGSTCLGASRVVSLGSVASTESMPQKPRSVEAMPDITWGIEDTIRVNPQPDELRMVLI